VFSVFSAKHATEKPRKSQTNLNIKENGTGLKKELAHGCLKKLCARRTGGAYAPHAAHDRVFDYASIPSSVAAYTFG
jgi:hypothetical protein